MWCESIQEKLQSCVDDEADLDKEDMTKRKIPTLMLWYLLVIDHLKQVFSNPRDAELVRMELSGNFLIFSIQNI
jgi:hypothetical protein